MIKRQKIINLIKIKLKHKRFLQEFFNNRNLSCMHLCANWRVILTQKSYEKILSFIKINKKVDYSSIGLCKKECLICDYLFNQELRTCPCYDENNLKRKVSKFIFDVAKKYKSIK